MRVVLLDDKLQKYNTRPVLAGMLCKIPVLLVTIVPIQKNNLNSSHSCEYSLPDSENELLHTLPHVQQGVRNVQTYIQNPNWYTS